MQNGGKGRPQQPGRGGAEAKAAPGRSYSDLNRERLIFCLLSLVGHRVTAKLRNNVMYEGVFHSCCVDGDHSITLKQARLLPSDGGKSGEIIHTLLIAGKDFMQVSASNVPPPLMSQEPQARAGAGFATDAEISASNAAGRSEGRELVPWAAEAANDSEAQGLEDSLALDRRRSSSGGAWDQFRVNQEKFGVSTTFNEEYYTTKLDPSTIPEEKRREAARIAREIEFGGNMNSEMDGRLEAVDVDDEEERWSSVQRTKVPLTREHLSQHEAAQGGMMLRDGFAQEHRTKRGMITAHSGLSPMRSPVVDEMKRINALNLEPALPKLDDKTKNDWINFKQNQSRLGTMHGNGLKAEFEHDLDLIRNRQQQSQTTSAAAKSRPSDRVPGDPFGLQQQQQQQDEGKGSKGQGKGDRPVVVPLPWGPNQSPTGADSTRSGGNSKSSFSFNPAAKEFTFNPTASVFTPTNAGAVSSASPAPTTPAHNAQAPPSAPLQAKPQPNSHPFQLKVVNAQQLQRRLEDIVEKAFEVASRESGRVPGPEWPEAKGPTYRETLGTPQQGSAIPSPAAMGAMGMAMPGGGAMPPQWQQPQQPPQQGQQLPQQQPGHPQHQAPPHGMQQQPGGPPPMAAMPPGAGGPPQQQMQGFMVANAGPGQQPQMYAQMHYPAQHANGMQVRPPGQGQMPPQGQGPMQPMVAVFNPQMMQGGPGGQQMIPMQGQVPGGMMVMPAQGMAPQGFMMQGQPGGPMQGPPQGQQGPGPQQPMHGMQPGWGQPTG
eukprot:TRINITY_DN3954_c0_g2_i1.p1 TRINITY_DN3954_c0_g2~~TRINITY_DN3954_c0_g2_i1.p1  ORF type:complete len:768 (-),score=177.93 TRINITY_DN3954_c0_g2_i1:88-2391(-)